MTILFLHDLSNLNQLSMLKTLSIYNCPMISNLPSTLATNHALNRITLKLKNLGSIEGIIGLDNLETLQIQFEKQTFSLTNNRAIWPQLKNLTLIGPVKDISALTHCQQLEVLTIEHAQFQTWPQGLSPQAITIRLSAITDASSIDCSQIRSLTLIGNAELTSVPSYEALSELKYLAIKYNMALQIEPKTVSYHWNIIDNYDRQRE